MRRLTWGKLRFIAQPQNRKKFGLRLFNRIFVPVVIIVLIGTVLNCFAQDGNAGTQEATNKVKGYFDTGCDLMYAIGAVVGIIGAFKRFCYLSGY